MSGWRGSARVVSDSPGAAVPIRGRDEPDGAVHRRGARRSTRRTSRTRSSPTTPYGAAIALALDLSLRDRSNGKRLARRLHAGDVERARQARRTEPGLVAKPYTLKDARDRLAEVSGDRAFADDFFDKYIEGREVPDYARALRARPASSLRKRSRGARWIGATIDVEQDRRDYDACSTGVRRRSTRVSSRATSFVAVDGKPLEQLKDARPGDVVVTLQANRATAQRIAHVTATERPGDSATIDPERRRPGRWRSWPTESARRHD